MPLIFTLVPSVCTLVEQCVLLLAKSAHIFTHGSLWSNVHATRTRHRGPLAFLYVHSPPWNIGIWSTL